MRLKTLAFFGLSLAACFNLDLPQQPVRSGLEATVTQQDGTTPLAGVSVTLTADSDGATQTATTDAAGKLSFTALVPGEYQLDLSLTGYQAVVRNFTLLPGYVKNLGTLRLNSTQQPGQNDGQIKGKVTTQVGDVTGTEVRFLVDATNEEAALTTVGASGEFTQRLPPNTYRITVSHPYYASPTPRTGITVGDKATVDLTMMPFVLTLSPARIQGRVLKERDLSPAPFPASGVTVTSDTGATAQTDQNGNFDLGGLPAGRRTLTYSFPGFHDPLGTRSYDVMPLQTKMVGDVELLLDRGDINGEVVMKDNTPLRDVTASLDLVIADGGTPDGGSGTPYSAAVAPSATNPSRGSFTIRGVPVGTWTVKASRTNYITALSSAIDVSYNRSALAGVLELVRIQGDFSIDDGDPSNSPDFTRTRAVTLRLSSAGNASEWRASEDDPTLASVMFQPFGALPDGGTTTPNSIPFSLSASDGTKTVYLQYKDATGNVSGILSANVVLDTVPPENLSLQLVDGADFTRSNVTLLATVSALDPRAQGVDNASGVGFVKLSATSTLDATGQLAGAPRKTYLPNVTFDRPTTSDGPQTVYAQFIDNAGNASALVSDSVVVDTVPPSTGSLTIVRGARATLDGYTATPLVELQLGAAAEPNGGYVQVKLANENAADLSGATLQPFRSSMAWFIEPTEGLRHVHVLFVDAAGNVGTQLDRTITYDVTPPAGTFTLTSGSPTSSLSATFTVAANDANGNPLSPTQALTLSEDPAFATATPGALVSPAMYTLSSGDGQKVVYARFRDAAGNDSTATAAVTLDQTAPSGTLAIEGTLADGTLSSTVTSSATVTLKIQQSGATQVLLGNETLTACPSAPAGYSALTGTTITGHLLTGAATPRQVRACLRDAAGNTFGPMTASITLDASQPTGCVLSLAGRKVDGTAAPAGKTALRDVTATIGSCVETPAEIFLTESMVTCSASAALAWVPFSASFMYSLTGADGPTTVRGCVRDAARNTQPIASAPITLDTLPPTVSPSIVLDLGAPYVNAAQVAMRGGNVASVTGTAAGATEWALSETNPPTTFTAFSGMATNFTFAGTGVRTLYAIFRDDVGNVTTVAQDSIEFDVTPPTGTGGAGLPSILLVGQLADGTSDTTLTATTTVNVQVTVEGATEYVLGNEALTSCPTSGYSALGGTTLVAQTLSGAATPRQMRACFRDAAGNTAGPVTDTIVLDGTAPTGCALTVNGTKRDGTAAPADRTASFDVSVSVAGCTETPVQIYLTEATPVCSATVSLPWLSYASTIPSFLLSGGDGSHTVRGCVRDAAGNVTSVMPDAIVLDTTPPSAASITLNAGAAWVNASQVTGGNTTLSVTGVATGAAEWAVAEGTPSSFVAFSAVTPFSLPISATPQGTRTVNAIFRDDLQNAITMAVSDTIAIDTDAPALSSFTVQGTLADGTLSSTDTSTASVTVLATVSGATEYLLGNETLTSCPASGYTSMSSSSLPWTLTGSTSPRTVRGCFRDAAGNTVLSAPATIALDTLTPTGCALTINGSRTDGSAGPANRTALTGVRVTVASCSETPSLIFLSEAPVSCTTSASFPWLPFSTTVNFTLAGGDGTHTVRGCVRDAAGNVGTATTDDIVLDQTAPSNTALVINNGNLYVNRDEVVGGNMTLDIAGTATGADEWAVAEGTPSSFVGFTGSTMLTLPATEGPHTISAYFRDDVWNTTTALTTASIRVDTQPPDVSAMSIDVRSGAAPVAGFTPTDSVTVTVNGSNDAVDAFLAEHPGAGACLANDFNLSPRQAVVSSYGFQLSGGEGSKRVCLRYKDAAGNTSNILEDDIILDTTPPTTPVVNLSDRYTTDPNMTSFVIDVAPSSDTYFYTYEKLGGLDSTGRPITSWTPTTHLPGQPSRFEFFEENDGGETGVRNEFRLRARDDAGNLSGEARLIVHADTNPPDPITWRPEWIDNGDERATVYFQQSSSADIDHYDVYYGAAPTFSDTESAGFANEGVSPVRIPPRANTTLSGLPNGATTYVRIRPVDRAGNVGQWLPDAGQQPLRLQPGEVSSNELAVLGLPGLPRVHRMVRHGNFLYALVTSAGCSLTNPSDVGLHAIDLREMQSPVQRGVARPNWNKPFVAASVGFTDAVTCLSGVQAGDLLIDGKWLYMLTPRTLRIFDLGQPNVLPTPWSVINLQALDFGANFRATSLGLIGDKLVISGRRGVGSGNFTAVLNVGELYNGNGVQPQAANFVSAPLLWNSTAVAMTSAVTRDRLVMIVNDGASSGQHFVNLTSSLQAAMPGLPALQGSSSGGPNATSRWPVSGNLGFFSTSSFGLSGFNMSTIWSGGTVMTATVTSAYTGSAQLDVSGHQIFLPDEGAGLKVLDAAETTFTRDVGRYSIGNPQNVVTFANYAAVSALDANGGRIHFLELASPRGLRTFTTEPGAGYHPAVFGTFLYTGALYVFDLQDGLAPKRTYSPTNPACVSGATYVDDVEILTQGNGFRVNNIETLTDHQPMDMPTGYNVALPGSRVTDVELFGHWLIVAEVRAGGVYVEVFPAGKAKNRSGVQIAAGDSVGSVLVTTATGPNLMANIAVLAGRVAVGLETNDGTTPPSAGTGNNLYFVELNTLLDDSVGSAPIVHGPVVIDEVLDVAMQGTHAYVATVNGLKIIDIGRVMDSTASMLTLPPSIAPMLTGNAFDGVFVTGATLLITPADRLPAAQAFGEGIYSVDVSEPMSPEVMGYFPVNGDFTSCTPGGEMVPRRMHARITVAGTRAYFTSGGLLRVLDLE